MNKRWKTVKKQYESPISILCALSTLAKCIVIWIFVIQCSQTTSNNMCQKRFEIIKNANYINWTGLPEMCHFQEFSEKFELISSHVGKGYIGKKNVPINFLTFKLPGILSPSRLWLDNDEFIKMIELDFPPFIDFIQLAKEIGEPSYKVDYYFGSVCIKNGEWIYPERGITFKLNADYERVIKILLYSPVSFEHYRDQISYSIPDREFRGN